MALKVPSVAGFLLPMSFFIAVLTTLGRLYAEDEMAIIQSAGIGHVSLAKMILPLGAALALFSGFLSFVMTPWANQEASVLSSKEAAQAKLGGLVAGRFSENKDKSGVVFIESKNSTGHIENLFVVSGISEGEETFEVQVASRGQIKKIRSKEENELESDYLVLNRGVNYAFDTTKSQWQLTEYEQYFMPLEQEENIEIESEARTASTLSLLSNSDTESTAEFHWRLSAPLSMLILVFMAVPLAKTQPRKGKFSRLFPAIMVYMVYALLMMNGRQLIEESKVPQILGFWWIHLIAIVYCLWAYWTNQKLRSRRGIASLKWWAKNV